ncbi:MAG: flagellar basal-body rod protein FlgG [Syntrophales bacterium]|nr:flagellar basal-body rod protein FlgG [Syntrophales bacterium]MDD5231839.1 flagellar basal-body rod protein FlgG [Syntrophales bacterium]MDD5531357.1 flagellar basal-body rod protein FlgG [Syntrophales bacterium]HPL62858.1 flagellar basal-body rod protein FlgG [Syntrophales bacterium]
MIRALWTAATGMEAKQISLDVIANNLANMSTTGFKKSRPEFQDLMYQILKKPGTDTSTGSQLAVGIEVGMGTKLGAIQKFYTQGDYVQTGNKFDWSIEGEGFFQLDNDGRTVYSRAGNFKVNKDGVLCNAEGLRLMPEISIPADTIDFTIDSGGTWTATDATGTSLASGRIEIAKFVNPAGLTSIGRNLFDATQGSGDATTGNPGTTGYGTISQHYLEMSNVNAIDEMVNMIELLRAYELNSKAIQSADQMLQTVSNLKR